MIDWQGLTATQLRAVDRVLSDRPDFEQNISVQCHQAGQGIRISRDQAVGEVVFANMADLMHGVSVFYGLAQQKKSFEIDEQPHFDVMVAMLDVARNGVPTVAMVKTYLRRIASMGYNELWLYLEDLFEVPEEPYFGRQRGRYSQVELHEIALYGDSLGVKVVPAIQTLAHVRNVLKWDAFHDIKDTDDTLLVNAPATRKFLKHLLQAASAPFTTNKIHVGMDEAYQLGRGLYIDKNGHYTDQQELIQDQLKLVVQLSEELGLKPYMWSDMWFTIASPKHEMYDPEVHFSPEFKAQLPEVGQVYWDYYHQDEQTYLDRFAQHFELSDNVVFAGGIWTWGSLMPNQSKMLATVDAGLKAAQKSGVKQVVATMWFDDGAETPIGTSWYGLQAFASYQYHDQVSRKVIDHDFELTQDEAPDFYLQLDKFDNFVKGANVECDNVSKLVLYEDFLLQRYEQNLATVDVEKNWLYLEANLGEFRLRADDQLMVQYYQKLASVLINKHRALKAVAALRDKQAGVLAGQRAIASLQLFEKDLTAFNQLSRQLWHQQRRGNGYEIIDVRLGGQLSRCQTVIWRIQEWQAGRDDLAELHEPLLPMDKHNNGPVGHGLYKEIVSACEISF
ncbi:beta-N-acetylhexosaminidase [Lapidilactobacillus gannanensis]|uniref:Family 20 glycosylhydrolase n=1 Tax=Lapidilactobacillus gannanensis TaxID=2486002 RepID=A0ABW4BNN6_9LACO|nr:beta-N-acetylhexosaminidase [Lapidilactobacillus gannanensis]